MAQQFKASIYSFDAGTNFAGNGGKIMFFPSQGVVISELSPAQQYQSTYCFSTIDLIYGQPPFPRYYAKESASALNTAANA